MTGCLSCYHFQPTFNIHTYINLNLAKTWQFKAHTWESRTEKNLASIEGEPGQLEEIQKAEVLQMQQEIQLSESRISTISYIQ